MFQARAVTEGHTFSTAAARHRVRSWFFQGDPAFHFGVVLPPRSAAAFYQLSTDITQVLNVHAGFGGERFCFFFPSRFSFPSNTPQLATESKQPRLVHATRPTGFSRGWRGESRRKFLKGLPCGGPSGGAVTMPARRLRVPPRRCGIVWRRSGAASRAGRRGAVCATVLGAARLRSPRALFLFPPLSLPPPSLALSLSLSLSYTASP